MAIVRDDCPHCGVKSVAFTVEKSVTFTVGPRKFSDRFVQCGHCGRGVLLMHDDASAGDYVVAPSLPDTAAPAHAPDNVARYFVQGMENLTRNFDAAGMMFRKALDTALTAKFPNIKGRLVDRIDEAAKQGAMTKNMADWAHQIRRLGNEAAHEEEPFSRQDAEELRSFTDLLLRYLFTLPGMLQAAQGKPKNPKARA